MKNYFPKCTFLLNVSLFFFLQIRDKFYDVQKQLHQASKWREAIVGEPYDLTFLHELTVNIDVLQELWKYVEVSRHAIKDWKQMLFKKVHIYIYWLSYMKKLILQTAAKI
jgi:hypothetical protein